MRMYGRLTLHAESVVLPLLASDAPVVTWWHGEPPGQARLRRARRARRRGGSPTRIAADDPIGRAASAGPRTTRPATPTWPGPGPRRGARCSPPAFDDLAAIADRRRGAVRARQPERRRCSPAGSTARLGVQGRSAPTSDGPGHHGGRGALRAERPAAHRPAGRLPGHAVAHRDVGPAAAAQAPRPRRPDRRGAAPAGRRPALRRGPGGRRPASRTWTPGRPSASTSGATRCGRRRGKRRDGHAEGGQEAGRQEGRSEEGDDGNEGRPRRRPRKKATAKKSTRRSPTARRRRARTAGPREHADRPGPPRPATSSPPRSPRG